MTKPWAAEHEVDEAQARALIEQQFPTLAPVHLRPFGVGVGNKAYLVNDRLVFRFPRNRLAADQMEVERAVLPHLVDRLPLPIPNPRFLGEPTAGYPWPFAGYAVLEGRTACTAMLDDAQRTRLATPLGRFLAALHAIPREAFSTWGVGPDTLGRLALDKRIPMARHYLARVEQLGLPAHVSPLHALVDAEAQRHGSTQAPPSPASTTVLLHSDLYARHLLVDDEHTLCGIIDWGDVHAGRPAVDLMLAHSFLPPAAHARFREAYGPIEDEEWRLARFRTVYHAAIVACYGYDVEDEGMLREGLITLRYLASPC